MEEKTPTMPGVIYLKYLKITGYCFDSQGKFEYAVCLENGKIQIIHHFSPCLASNNSQGVKNKSAEYDKRI